MAGELDETRVDNPRGMGLVGLAFLAGLILLGRYIKCRSQVGSSIESVLREEWVTTKASAPLVKATILS